MNFKEEVNKIKKRLGLAQNVLVAVKKEPEFDSIASALALYLSLTKLGKRATIFCPDKIRVELSSLVGVDKVTDKIGGRDFVVSLDYKEGSIDKVSYNIKDGKFNLVIKARPEAPKLSAENVHYSHAGEDIDLLFVIDTLNLQELGEVVEKKKEIFSQDKIVSITSRSSSSDLGKINLVVSQAASTSEIVALLLRSLPVKLNRDIANNLLAGIVFGSDNFNSPKTSAVTFETAASCLRAGAKKPSLPSKLESKDEVEGKKKKEEKDKTKEAKPAVKTSEVEKDEEAPPDWLKPKIYKSSENSKRSTLL